MESKKMLVIILFFTVVCFLIFIFLYDSQKLPEKNISSNINKNSHNSFVENFSENFILEESGDIQDSLNENWWVNSGAFLISENGIGRTVFGELAKNSKWQKKFENSRKETSLETDFGYHPQNIFRLVTKTKWKNYEQEVYFRIREYNKSSDIHRGASNGILLFNRYQDGSNLYYTGLRVDGTAIIKKKINGKYYTLAQKKVYSGKYDKDSNPNLLPKNNWIGVKSEVKNVASEVHIKLYIREDENSKNWREVLDIIDYDTKYYNTPAIFDDGYAGIRTDFMDVEFDNYKITEIINY